MKKVLKWFLIGISLFVLAMALHIYLSLPDVRELETKNPETTALIEYRIRQAQKSYHNNEIQQYWVEFDTIPELFKKTIRISEDDAFYQHRGIDYTELKEAIKKNWEKRKIISLKYLKHGLDQEEKTKI